MLAPLAGIGNWFVRLQAKRFGAGLAVSEMISSFAIHYGNRKTLDELLVVHPDEGPVAIQLFGHDPEIMRSAAAEELVARGADASWVGWDSLTAAGAARRSGHESLAAWVDSLVP